MTLRSLSCFAFLPWFCFFGECLRNIHDESHSCHTMLRTTNATTTLSWCAAKQMNEIRILRKLLVRMRGAGPLRFRGGLGRGGGVSVPNVPHSRRRLLRWKTRRRRTERFWGRASERRRQQRTQVKDSIRCAGSRREPAKTLFVLAVHIGRYTEPCLYSAMPCHHRHVPR